MISFQWNGLFHRCHWSCREPWCQPASRDFGLEFLHLVNPLYLQYQEWSEPMSSCTSRILFICSIKNDRNLFFQTCLNGARRRRRTGAVPLASPEIEFQSGWIFKCFYGWNRRSHITHLKIITTASAICLKSNKGIRYAKNTMMPPILPRRQKMVKLWVTLGPLKLVQNQKSFWILSN